MGPRDVDRAQSCLAKSLCNLDAKSFDDLDHGNAHAFSFFVHSETRRCLDDQPGLQVPGMSGRQAAAAAATIL